MRTLKDYVLFILSLIVVIWISMNWAKADTWVMNKVEPLDGEVMQIKSAPVTDVYINDIHEKVQKKLKLLNENEKKGVLKENIQWIRTVGRGISYNPEKCKEAIKKAKLKY